MDAVLEDARGGGVDDAPVAVDGGAGDGAGGVGVEEEGEAGGACRFCWLGGFGFWCEWSGVECVSVCGEGGKKGGGGKGVVCDGVDVRFEGVEKKEIKNEMLFSGG